MEAGIYISKVEEVKNEVSGRNKYGNWLLLKLTFSIRVGNKQNVYSYIEPSWNLEEMYISYFKTKPKSLSEWRELKGKTILIFFEEGKKPEIIEITKQTP